MKRYTRVVGGMIGVVAAVVLSVSAGSAQTPVFRSAQTYGLTGTSQSTLYVPVLALADVGAPPANGPDGIPDLITASPGGDGGAGGNVAVLFGNPDGSFALGPGTHLSSVPTAFAAADFDHDGVVDLLISDNSNMITFYQNFSDGPPFAKKGSPIAAGTGPIAIVARDLNGDDKLDAVVVDDGQGSTGGVSILIGNNDGTFQTRGFVSTGLGASAVAIADFNKDGKLDLAVTNAGNSNVSILRGDGQGGFALVQTVNSGGNEPVAIAARDLNGDGFVDLAVANRSGDNIAVIDGSASGFRPARPFASGTANSEPNGIALDDFNGDGKIDLVVSNKFSSDVSVLLGDGHGSFGAPRGFVADQEPLSVVVSDVNQDGTPDVMTLNQGVQIPDVVVLLGNPDGSLVGVEDLFTQPNPDTIVCGDVDNDGLPDLIVGHPPAPPSTVGTLLVYRARAQGGFAPPTSVQSVGDGFGLARGDFNGDGRLDLVTVNQSTKDVSVYLARAGGGFASGHSYPLGAAPSAVTAGDWNHDGRSDLAVTFQSRQCSVTTATLCSSNAGCPEGHCSVTTTRACHTSSECPSVETCQGGEICLGAVGILSAQPDGTLGSLTTMPVGSGPVAVDFGDFNKDGKLDLVVANTASNELSILSGNGDGTFQPASTISNLPGVRGFTVADFDRDGRDDLAVILPTQLQVNVLYGRPQGFIGGPILPVGGTPAGLVARDVTGDSIPDLIVADQVNNSVITFVGNGPGHQFFQDNGTFVGRGPSAIVSSAVVAGDFNGDGGYDAATVDNFLAGTAPVLTNVRAPAVLRGDGNGDAVVSAADATAALLTAGKPNGVRIEDINAAGAYLAAPGVDANGDGIVNAQDALAVAHRVFIGS